MLFRENKAVVLFFKDKIVMTTLRREQCVSKAGNKEAHYYKKNFCHHHLQLFTLCAQFFIFSYSMCTAFYLKTQENIKQKYKFLAYFQEMMGCLSFTTLSFMDIVLIAGKGHERFQIIGDQKIHFSDEDEVKKAALQIKTS